MDLIDESLPHVTQIERLQGILPRLQEAYDEMVPPYSKLITPRTGGYDINGWQLAVLQEYDPRFESQSRQQVHISKHVHRTGRGPSLTHMEMLEKIVEVTNFMPDLITFSNRKVYEYLNGTSENTAKVVCLFGKTEVVKINVMPGGSTSISISTIDPTNQRINDTNYQIYLLNNEGDVSSVLLSDFSERSGSDINETDQIKANSYLLLAEVCAEIASN